MGQVFFMAWNTSYSSQSSEYDTLLKIHRFRKDDRDEVHNEGRT
jgi:hypothetical protein